jgi:ankyrin repeat protein
MDEWWYVHISAERKDRVFETLMEHRCFIDVDVDCDDLWYQLGNVGTVMMARHIVRLERPWLMRIESALRQLCHAALDEEDFTRRKDMIHFLHGVAVKCGYTDIHVDELLDGCSGSEMFEYLLDEFKVDISVGTGRMNPQMLLFHAVFRGSERIVNHLIQNNLCDINTPLEKWRIAAKSKCTRTALSMARSPAVVRILLNAKADVNPKDSLSVLTGACSHLKPEAVELLLNAGAPATSTGNAAFEEISPLESAIMACRYQNNNEQHQVAVINQLLRAGAHTRSLHNGASAMTIVCRRRTFEYQPHPNDADLRCAIISALHAHDPGLVDLCDGNGLTPLHQAVAIRSLETVQLLLKLGANPNPMPNVNKPTVSVFSSLFKRDDYDSIENKIELLRILIAAGADPITGGSDSVLLWLYRIKTVDFDDGKVAAMTNDMLKAIANRPVAAAVEIDTEESGEESEEGRQRKRLRRG